MQAEERKEMEHCHDAHRGWRDCTGEIFRKEKERDRERIRDGWMEEAEARRNRKILAEDSPTLGHDLHFMLGAVLSGKG